MNRRLFAMLSALAFFQAACSSEPRTDAERLARGREILDRVSAKLGSATSFSFTTNEVRDRLKASGAPEKLALTRHTIVRRPDRLYFRTTGDLENEAWYDGVGLTVAMHKDKVFGQARLPETLDRALDAINERYGVSTPFSDFLHTSPSKALLTDTTTGGWTGRETIGGQETDHLTFLDHGLEFQVWVASSGDPVPLRLHVTYPESKKRLRVSDVTFSEWNFSPQIAADRFDPQVPSDYEGIAIIQRAAVLRHMPEDPPADEAKKDATKK